MTIETKYNIGDEVWYCLRGKIYHNVIDGITIDIVNGQVWIHYSWEGKFPMKECVLFPTKEELLKSL